MLSQDRYARKILAEAGMANCNLAHVPMEVNIRLSRSIQEKGIDEREFRRSIGCLRYLLHTRPDLSFSVRVLSRYMQEPKVSHGVALKQVLRYLRGTTNLGLMYIMIEIEFKWYDTKVRRWRVLKGVKGLPKIPRYTARTADCRGKMAVLWDRDVASTGYVDKMIWCAVIALERCSDEEIWGKLEWKEPVLEVPKSCRIIRALAATL